MDFAELDAAIDTQLRHDLAALRRQCAADPLRAVAVCMVEDLTGFFTAGLTESRIARTAPANRYEWFYPSEWGLAADDDAGDPAPGRVTTALWALTGTCSDAGEVDEDTYEEIRGEYEDRLVATLARLRGEPQRTRERVEAFVARRPAIEEHL